MEVIQLMTNSKKLDQKQLEEQPSCCQIAAIIPIDRRGQIVLPKELRERADIGPGDKLALVAHEADGKVCCISLFKSNDLSELIKDKLSPLMKDILD